ncbi:hypothetical protein [Azospirillum doebereinerae]
MLAIHEATMEGCLADADPMTHDDALRAIIQEAAAARSALCENELVIRLDNILNMARTALDAKNGGDENGGAGNGGDPSSPLPSGRSPQQGRPR